MPLLHGEDWQNAAWLAAPLRFLASASQAARNASASISNQLICHDPRIPGSKSFRNSPEPVPAGRSLVYATPASSPNETQLLTSSPAGGSGSSVEPELREDVSDFAAYICSQGPRALEIGTVEEYRKHYNDSKAWKRKMLGPFQRSPTPTTMQSKAKSSCGVAVEEPAKMKTMASPGLFRLDWARYCKKHGSRSNQFPLPAPPRPQLSHGGPISKYSHQQSYTPTQNISRKNTKPHSPRRDGCLDDMNPFHTTPASLPDVEQGNSSNIPKPQMDSNLNTALETPNTAGSSDYPTPALSMAASPNFPVSPVSPKTPQIPTDQSSNVPRAVPSQKPENRSRFALYPSDHKLGFNCICSTCEERRRKLKGLSQVPSIYERRFAVRSQQTPNRTAEAISDCSKSGTPADKAQSHPTGDLSRRSMEAAITGSFGSQKKSGVVEDVGQAQKEQEAVKKEIIPPYVIDLTTPALDPYIGCNGLLAGIAGFESDQSNSYPIEAQAELVKILGKRGRDDFENGQIYMAVEDDMNVDIFDPISNKRQRKG